MLAIPVFLPIVLGALTAFCPIKSMRVRQRVIEAIVILSSALCIAFLCMDCGEVTLFHLTDNMPIAFRQDGLAKLFAGMISVLWPLATLYAFEYMEHMPHKKAFFTFYTMTQGVTMGIALSANLATMYFFYELLTLVTLPLVAHGLDHEAMRAARKYLYYSLGGAACAFIGMMILLNTAGTTSFVAGGLTFNPEDIPLVLVAFLFCFAGFGVKAAVFPMHSWLPAASVAPTPVTALLHAVAVVKSGVFAIIRVAYFCFGASLLSGTYVQYVALALAAVTIVYGSATAVREIHIKRRLAYSTISNLSYVLLGAMLFTEAGLSAGLLHMLFHSIMKIALFSVAGAIIEKTGRENVPDLRGIGRAMPYSFAAFGIASLALVGIPPLVGFISKWYLADAAIAADWWPLVIVLILSAVLTAIYLLPVVVRGYFSGGEEENHEAGWKMLLPITVFVVLIVLFGVYPQPILSLVTEAVKGVF